VGYEFPEEVDYQLKEDLLEIFFKYFDEDFRNPFDKRRTDKELSGRIFIAWETCIDCKVRKLKSA